MTETALPPSIALFREEMDRARRSLRRLQVTPRSVHRLSSTERQLRELHLRMLAVECHIGMIAAAISGTTPSGNDATLG